MQGESDRYIVFERQPFLRWWRQSEIGGTVHLVKVPDEVTHVTPVGDCYADFVEHEGDVILIDPSYGSVNDEEATS